MSDTVDRPFEANNSNTNGMRGESPPLTPDYFDPLDELRSFVRSLEIEVASLREKGGPPPAAVAEIVFSQDSPAPNSEIPAGRRAGGIEISEATEPKDTETVPVPPRRSVQSPAPKRARFASPGSRSLKPPLHGSNATAFDPWSGIYGKAAEPVNCPESPVPAEIPQAMSAKSVPDAGAEDSGYASVRERVILSPKKEPEHFSEKTLSEQSALPGAGPEKFELPAKRKNPETLVPPEKGEPAGKAVSTPRTQIKRSVKDFVSSLNLSYSPPDFVAVPDPAETAEPPKAPKSVPPRETAPPTEFSPMLESFTDAGSVSDDIPPEDTGARVLPSLPLEYSPPAAEDFGLEKSSAAYAPESEPVLPAIGESAANGGPLPEPAVPETEEPNTEPFSFSFRQIPPREDTVPVSPAQPFEGFSFSEDIAAASFKTYDEQPFPSNDEESGGRGIDKGSMTDVPAEPETALSGDIPISLGNLADDTRSNSPAGQIPKAAETEGAAKTDYSVPEETAATENLPARGEFSGQARISQQSEPGDGVLTVSGQGLERSPAPENESADESVPVPAAEITDDIEKISAMMQAGLIVSEMQAKYSENNLLPYSDDGYISFGGLTSVYNIKFQDGGSRPLYEDLDLSVPKGSCTAFVSGTPLDVHALLRATKNRSGVKSGKILVNGRDSGDCSNLLYIENDSMVTYGMPSLHFLMLCLSEVKDRPAAKQEKLLNTLEDTGLPQIALVDTKLLTRFQRITLLLIAAAMSNLIDGVVLNPNRLSVDLTDEYVIKKVFQLLHKNGKTVLFSGNNMALAACAANRIAALRDGKLFFDGQFTEFVERFCDSEFSFISDDTAFIMRLREKYPSARYEKRGDRVVVSCGRDESSYITDIVGEVLAYGVNPRSIATGKKTFEYAFRRMADA